MPLKAGRARSGSVAATSSSAPCSAWPIPLPARVTSSRTCGTCTRGSESAWASRKASGGRSGLCTAP
eukprot:1197333-Pyramimonas_sp.AAC.1